MECDRVRWTTSSILWGVVMNQRFFIHSITIYHDNDDGTVTRMVFEGVYFRHNKKSNVIDKGFDASADFDGHYVFYGSEKLKNETELQYKAAKEHLKRLLREA